MTTDTRIVTTRGLGNPTYRTVVCCVVDSIRGVASTQNRSFDCCTCLRGICVITSYSIHYTKLYEYDEKGNVLYVGKAKNLKNRVTNYTRPEKLVLRIQRMIFQTAYMECSYNFV